MGRDKAWLPWRGRSLLAHVVDILRSLSDDVIMVARPGQSLPGVRARHAEDRILGAGPLAGLEAGLSATETPYAIVVACDMPWLNPVLLRAMLDIAGDREVVIPYAAGRYHPLHAVYARRLVPTISELIDRGERRLHALVERAKVQVVDEPFLHVHDPSGQSLGSVDTLAAYEAAQGP